MVVIKAERFNLTIPEFCKKFNVEDNFKEEFKMKPESMKKYLSTLNNNEYADSLLLKSLYNWIIKVLSEKEDKLYIIKDDFQDVNFAWQFSIYVTDNSLEREFK